MRPFEDLIAEAIAADVTGWRFDWLDGRATEERPWWGYARLLAQRLRHVRSVLDLDTGGGEILAEMPYLPARSAATESWPPQLTRAREALEVTAARNAHVTVVDLQQARCRMEFYDVGAMSTS